MTLAEHLISEAQATVDHLTHDQLRCLILELRSREQDIEGATWGPDWEALHYHAQESAVARFLRATDPGNKVLPFPNRLN